MAYRLADAISPYLRSHSENPVDWWPWGDAAFAEAARRGVPVLVSIGYSSCHWCHVMARESFSDPIIGAYVNENFVAIKVDREEHPDVDGAYMAAAGAFTRNLGWPLNVVSTPEGAPFFAGSYFPPRPANGMPDFLSVLRAVVEAWTERRSQVDAGADALLTALRKASKTVLSAAANEEHRATIRDAESLARAAAGLLALEDAPYGGFGTAPKFPMAPLLGFLIGMPAGQTRELGLRTLKRMGASPLRDPVDGGFFRYSTERDWSDPHYERMLIDNALLLEDATAAWILAPDENRWALSLMEGIAEFLGRVMRLASGGFASAQDSESTIAGRRSEGGYYRMAVEERAMASPPSLDEKILAGWNGLAIGALAQAGAVARRADWVALSREAAGAVLRSHRSADGTLKRAALDGRVSEAMATLEDYGMLASGLVRLARATGEVEYAAIARELVDATMRAPSEAASGAPFEAPGGADPTLSSHGMALTLDVSEGSSPSGFTAVATAAHELFLLGAGAQYRLAAEAMADLLAPAALAWPIGYGGVLGLLSRLERPVVQLVVVTPDAVDADGEILDAARAADTAVTAVVSSKQCSEWAAAGFELFEGRAASRERAVAFLCRDFSCRVPIVIEPGMEIPFDSW